MIPKEIEKMKINWKDFVIAFIIGLILFYVPSVIGIPMGLYSTDLFDPSSDLLNPSLLIGLFLIYAVPLGFYLFRNSYDDIGSIYFSIIYGILFLPAYVLTYWVPSNLHPYYWLPNFSGLMSILMISLASSVLSCLVVLLITHLRELRELKISWKDFAIALLLGFVLVNILPSLFLRVFGSFSFPFEQPFGLAFYSLSSVIPLGFYFFRNRYNITNLIGFSVIFGVVSIPLYLILYTLILEALCPGCWGWDSTGHVTKMYIPFYPGSLFYTFAFSILSSLISCLFIILITQLARAGQSKTEKAAKRKRKPGNRV